MTLDEMVAQMEQLRQNRETYQLQQTAQKVIETQPDSALGYYYLGEAYIEYWQFQEAVDALNKALERDANNVLYLRRKAFALLKMQHVDGLAIYEKLLAEQPNDGGLCLELGRYYVDNWNADKAQPLLKKAMELLPNDWEPPYQLARILYSSGLKAEEALPLINRAVELKPCVETLDLRVGVNKFLKNFEACEADLKQLIDMSPRQSNYWHNLANFYIEIEEWTKGDAAYTRAIEIDANNGYPSHYSLISRGDARMQAGNLSGALEDYNAALDMFVKINPQSPIDPMLLSKRAQAKEAMDDLQGAIDDLQTALNSNDNNYYKREWNMRLGQIYVEMQDWAKAEKHLKETAQEGDDWSKGQMYMELGKMYQAQGNLEQAYEHWLLAKTNHAYEAEDYIERYCKAIIEAQKDKQDELVAKEFETYNRPNSRSVFMQRLFDKCWQLDPEKTLHYNLENNPMAMMLPDEFRGILLSVLDDVKPWLLSLHFTFDAATLKIATSLKTESIQTASEQVAGGMGFNFKVDASKFKGLTAYYKILKETAEMAQIHAKRTGGKGNQSDVRVLDLMLEGDDVLRIDGIADKPLTIFCKTTTTDQLPDFSPDEQQELIEKLKARAQEVLMAFMGSMAQGLGNVFKNMNKGGDAFAEEDKTPPPPANNDDDDDDDNDGGADARGDQA